MNDEDEPGLGGANARELELMLQLLQQASFASWEDKILAGNFQRRLDVTLKGLQ